MIKFACSVSGLTFLCRKMKGTEICSFMEYSDLIVRCLCVQSAKRFTKEILQLVGHRTKQWKQFTEFHNLKSFICISCEWKFSVTSIVTNVNIYFTIYTDKIFYSEC